MNLSRSIILNTITQLGGQGLSYLLGAFSMMLIMRYLGPNDFGSYSLVLVYVGIVASLGELGGQTVLVRELNQQTERSSKIIGNYLLLKLFLYSAAFLFGLVIARSMRYQYNIKILLALGLLAMLCSFPVSLGAVFQARLKIWYAVAINIVGKILLIILVLLMIWLQKGLNLLLLGNIFIAIIISLVYWIFADKQEKPDYTPDRKLMSNLFLQSLPIGLIQVVGGLAFRSDILLLSKLSDPHSLGLYSAASKYVEWGFLVASGIMISHLPIFSQYYKTDPEKVEKLFNKSFGYIGLVFIPVSVFVSTNSRGVISLISGSAYIGGAAALSVLIWVVLFSLWGTIIYNIFLAKHRTKYLMAVYFPVMAFNIISNYYSIPKYGFWSCAIISLLSEVLSIVPLLILLYRWDKIRPDWGGIFRFGLIGLLAVIPMGIFSSEKLFLRLVSYFTFWLLLGFITKAIDMDKLRLIINKM